MHDAAGDALQLAERVLIARAAGLARAGEYESADQLVAGLSSAPALDLRARIRAQQGLLGDAERFWQLAARLQPDQPAYRDGLQRIARLQRRPAWWLLVPGRIALAVLLLTAFIIVYEWLRQTDGSAPSDPGGALAEIATDSSAPPPTNRPDPPSLDLAADGITVSREAGELVARFDQGLFGRGTDLRAGADALLTELARRITGHASPLRVRVIGGTDDVPIRAGAAFADNVALGFARALRVAERLRAAGVAHTALTVESAGATTVSPGATPDARARARTVTLRVARGGNGGS
ncbi:MAG: hypothetical protein L0271_27185 [Gemmatimonadetes bacterium]|nr:hypothetical protein [Gemmatimonadota bacterium]